MPTEKEKHHSDDDGTGLLVVLGLLLLPGAIHAAVRALDRKIARDRAAQEADENKPPEGTMTLCESQTPSTYFEDGDIWLSWQGRESRGHPRGSLREDNTVWLDMGCIGRIDNGVIYQKTSNGEQVTAFYDDENIWREYIDANGNEQRPIVAEYEGDSSLADEYAAAAYLCSVVNKQRIEEEEEEEAERRRQEEEEEERQRQANDDDDD